MVDVNLERKAVEIKMSLTELHSRDEEIETSLATAQGAEVMMIASTEVELAGLLSRDEPMPSSTCRRLPG